MTRAARRLHRTQSATSHALARLRRLFDDPLLVREGTRLVPTQRAVSMQAELAAIVSGISDLLDPEPAFDPSSASTRFSVAVPDFLPRLGPVLVSAVLDGAPGCTVDVVAATPGVIQQAAAGGLDAAVTFGSITRRGLTRVEGGWVPWVAVVRPGHPLLDGDVTRARLGRFGRVVVAAAVGSPEDVGARIVGSGRSWPVVASVPSHAEVAAVVHATDLVALVPRTALDAAEERLAEVRLPGRIPPLAIAWYWAAVLTGRPHHAWLRERLREALAVALPQRW